MIRNYREQNLFTPYLVENHTGIIGNYKDFQTAQKIARALKGYWVIRFHERKVDES